MKNKCLLIAVILAFATLFVSCGSDFEKDADGLNIEFEKALKIAPKNKQNILLLITMEGDDMFSEAFMNSVVRTENFKSEIMEKYTVVHVDFSQASYEKTASKMNLTKEENKLAEKYASIMEYNSSVVSLLSVQYSPSFFLLTENGYYIADSMLSDQFRSTADFVSYLDNYKPQVERMTKLFEKADKGTSLEKVNAINDIYDTTRAERRILLKDYIKQVPELDKTNRTGLVGKFILAAAEVDAFNYYNEGDILKAAKAYADAANKKFLEPADIQNAYLTAAYLLASAGSQDFDYILTYFKQALDAAPESALAPEIQKNYELIQTIKANYEMAAEEALQKQNEDIASTVFEEIETSSDELEAESAE